MKLLSMKIKNITAFGATLLCVGLLSGVSVSAEEDVDDPIPADVSNSFDFQKLGGMTSRLAPHGNDLMGDLVDKNTGGITFEHVDVSIPGNSNLEVALRRKLRQGNSYYTPYQHGFSDWLIDLPIAYTVYAPNNSAGAPAPQFDNGCLIDYGPMRVDGDIGGFGVRVPIQWADITTGVTLHVPGKGISGFEANPKTPHDPKSNWVPAPNTTDHAGRCATQVISPDGTKYKFGRHVIRQADSFKATYWHQISGDFGSPRRYQGYLPRKHAVYLITEVEDINGNWVRYEYSNDARAELTRIHSNDLREIKIHYESAVPATRNSRRVSHVTANNRTWSYDYVSNFYLHKVTLPDGRFWELGNSTFGMGVMASPVNIGYKCLPIDRTFSMKHPDGAIGNFRILETRHIKGVFDLGSFDDDSDHNMFAMNIPFAPNNSECAGTQQTPAFTRPIGWPIFRAMSLSSKTISGANIPTATWNYEYRNYSGGSLDENWTKITGPDGTERTYTHKAVGGDHGLLKRVDINPASGPGETIEYGYNLSEPVHLFSCLAGGSFGDTAGICTGFKKRPLATVVHTRDGVTYTRSYLYDKLGTGAFIDHGRPNKITRYSTLQPEQRITEVDYWHNSSANIIGRTGRVVKNGKEFVYFHYNTKGLPTYVNKFGALWETYGYHADGNLKTIKDPLNHIATLENYYRGQPRKIIRRDGSIFHRTLDVNGWVTSETDGRGFTTNYDYNDVGWMTLVDRPSPWEDTTVDYESIGTANFYSKELRGTKENVTWYDMMLRSRLIRDRPISGGGKTVYVKTEYDKLGRVVFYSQPSSTSNPTKGTSTIYDGLGRITQVSKNFGPNATTSMAYLSGNRVRVTDPKGNLATTTKSGYASPNDGQVTLIEQPEDVNTTMSYDVYGNLLTATQSGPDRSSTQVWSLDNRLRVCRHYVPETGSKLYQYDAADQIRTYGEGNSGSSGCASSIPVTNRVALSYDERGRNTVIDYPSGPSDIIKTYDDDGNLRTIVNGDGSWVYTYNYLNKVETETLSVNSQSFLLEREYNGMGDMDALTYPSGRDLSLELNGLGQTTGVDGFVTDATYHPSGAMNTITYGNGMTYSTSLNDRLLPRDMYVNNANGERLSDLVFSWDSNGNVTRIQDLVNAQYTVDMNYDGLDRLTEADGYWGNGSIEYDSLGNVKTKNLGNQTLTYHYDTHNRLGYVTGSKPYTFSYDLRGNVIHNGDRAFTFNLQNQLSGSEGVGFTYDGHGKRVTKTVNGDKSYSVYGLDSTLYYRQKPNGDHVDYVYINGRLVTTVESR